MELITVSGERHPLHVGVNSIGRAGDNQIVLNCEPVSRHHAELHWDGQQCHVIDLQSRNGTFLNGRQLPPFQPALVPAGAQLCFGPEIMTLHLPGQKEQAGGGGDARRPAGAGLGLVVQALSAALDARKLGLGFAGLLAATVALVATGWISAQFLLNSPILAGLTSLIGLVAVWLILTGASGAISRLAIVELSEGKREAIGGAVAYAGRHLLSFLLSPLVLLFASGIVLLVEEVFLLIGRIDYLGEIVVSLAFLPLMLLNLGVLVAAWFGPALVFPAVAHQGGGIGATLRQVLTTLRRRPGQVIAYMMLAGIVSLLMFVLCLYLISAALYTTVALVAVGMEPAKFTTIIASLPFDLGGLLGNLPLGGLTGLFGPEPPPTYGIARLFFGLSGLGLVALILALPQSFYLCSACAVYLGAVAESGPAVTPAQGLAAAPAQGRASSGTEATQAVSAPGRKPCRYCGTDLAYDQVYCPECGNLQR